MGERAVLQYRPTCRACGYRDEATFTARQMDTCDFRCPRCDSIYFDFPIELAQSAGADE